jgi:multidrug resistance efflux pump
MPNAPASVNQSDALHEFLTVPPSWLLHSGMGLISLIALIGLTLCWFIQFPDRSEGTVLVRTEQAPVELVSPTVARLDSILAPDQSRVKRGQAICLLQSTANWAHLIMAEKALQNPQSLQNKTCLSWQLGDVQQNFSAWRQACLSLWQYQGQTIVQEQVFALQSEAEQNQNLAQALHQRKDLYQQEAALVQKDLDRSSKLNQQKVISDLEMEAKTSAWLQSRRQMQNLQEESIQNQVRGKQLKTQQLQLLAERENRLAELRAAVQQSAQALQAALDAWKQQYLLTAPIDGTLNWATGLGQGQFLSNTKAPGTIIPHGQQKLVAVCTVPSTGSGRMALGNRVHIRLDAYPAEQYGHLEARVKSIARLPLADQEGKFYYEVIADLPHALHNAYGTLPYRPNLSGTAYVFTKERRILERMLGKIWDMGPVR